MAYKISYMPHEARRYPPVGKKNKMKWGRYYAVLFFLAAAIWLRLTGIPDFLIPGDPEITRGAAQAMVTDVKSGVALDDAVTAFCQQILNSVEK